MRNKTNMPATDSKPASILEILAIELVCLLISLIVVFGIAFGFVVVADHIYDIKHLMPDPVGQGKDLGAGIVMASAAFISLFVSLPIAFLIHLFAFRQYFSRRRRKQ